MKNSGCVLTFLVFMKRSGTRYIENHKLPLHFLATIAKLYRWSEKQILRGRDCDKVTVSNVFI